jgi:hypothetical protein
MLTGIQFPLTIFLYCCQTWKNKESEFQPAIKHGLSILTPSTYLDKQF